LNSVQSALIFRRFAERESQQQPTSDQASEPTSERASEQASKQAKEEETGLS